MNLKPRNIFIISTWSFHEPLAQSYLLPYMNILKEVLPTGSQIHFLTMEKIRFRITHEEQAIFERSFKSQNIHWHRHDYVDFGAKAALKYSLLIFRLCWLVWRSKIEVLHPFAPVAGAIALQVKNLTGRKLVLDSWEPHAESMVESGVWKRDSFAFRYLSRSERKLTKRSDFLIATVASMKEYALQRWNLTPQRISTRPACVDISVFDSSKFDRQLLRNDFGYTDKIVAVCTGKLADMYLGKEVIRFLYDAYKFFGERFRAYLLTETPIDLIELWCKEVGLPLRLVRIESLRHTQIPRSLAVADFAINPQKPLPSKRYGTPVKDGEYWAMGLPIVIPPNISDDSDIALAENVGVIWSTNNEDNTHVLQQLDLLLQDKGIAERCVNAAMKYRSYDLARKAYQQVYSTI